MFEDLLRILLDNSDKSVRKRSFLIHLEHSTQVEEKPTKEDIRVQHLLSTWEDIIPDDFKFSFFDGDSWQELDMHEKRGGATFGSLQERIQQLLDGMFEDFRHEEQTSFKGMYTHAYATDEYTFL